MQKILANKDIWLKGFCVWLTVFSYKFHDDIFLFYFYLLNFIFEGIVRAACNYKEMEK